MAFDSISPVVIDSMARACSRLLIQFQTSPILIDVLKAFIDEIQELQDAINDIIKLRGPADATAVQLDGIGRIVGQNRTISDFVELNFFTPDVDGFGPDSEITVWVDGAPLLADSTVNDEVYRQFIEAKIHRNFAQYGSVNELKETARAVLDAYIGFVRTGPMEIAIAVENSIPRVYIDLFTKFNDTAFVEKAPFLPYAETVRISGVIFLPDIDLFFAPDISEKAADIGLAAVSFPL